MEVFISLLIYKIRRIPIMKTKKHVFFSHAHKPKLTLKIGKQMRDITNQNNKEFSGLKFNSMHNKQEEIKMKIFKPEEESLKRSLKRISLKTIEQTDQSKIYTISSKKKLQTLEIESAKPGKALSIDRRSRAATMSHPKNILNNMLSGQLDQYKQFFHELQESLKHDNSITNFNSLFFTVKHDKFHEIVLKIIKTLVIHNKKQQKKIDPFSHSIQSIRNHFLKTVGEVKEVKLYLNSGIFSFEHNPLNYKLNILAKIHKAEDLNEQIKHLQHQIDEKTGFLSKIAQNQTDRLKETKKYQQKIYEIRREIQYQEIRLKELQGKILNMEDKLNKIELKYYQTIEFVTKQDKNKILKQVSSEYKQIQGDIYQYASYLQCNQLANDIYYEPHPFAEMQKHINYQLKILISDTMSNQEKPLEVKCNQMKEFIIQVMGKFKKKDSSMMSVNEFRAKCIANFVNKMKKWLNNWQLKQEYLVNLKKQFIAIILILKESIGQLLLKISHESEESLLKAEDLKIMKLVEQLQVNFNHGNSFY